MSGLSSQAGLTSTESFLLNSSGWFKCPESSMQTSLFLTLSLYGNWTNSLSLVPLLVTFSEARTLCHILVRCWKTSSSLFSKPPSTQTPTQSLVSSWSMWVILENIVIVIHETMFVPYILPLKSLRSVRYLIFLFNKDPLNWSRMTGETFVMLYLSNYAFYLLKNPETMYHGFQKTAQLFSILI